MFDEALTHPFNSRHANVEGLANGGIVPATTRLLGIRFEQNASVIDFVGGGFTRVDQLLQFRALFKRQGDDVFFSQAWADDRIRQLYYPICLSLKSSLTHY